MLGILSLTFFQWVLSNSFKASVLVIIILLIKLLFKDKISARIQYLLWLVVVVRLILPWTPQSPYSIYNLFQNGNNKLPKISYTMPLDKSITPRPNEVVSDETKETAIAVTPTSNFTDNKNTIAELPTLNYFISEPWTMEKSFIVVWLLGVFVLMIISFVRNRVFARKLNAKQVTKEEMNLTFKTCKDKLRVQANIPLLQTDKVTSPSLYGVFRPMLLLPEQVQNKLSSKQLAYVFVHELVHFKHKDIFVNWVIHFLVILHWFNPLIWYVNYKMREDQELACDEFALSYIGTEEASDYGLTLITLLESYSKTKGYVSLASISGSKSQIKRRLKMLRKASFKWSLLALVVVFVISFVALTNAKTNDSAKSLPNPPVSKSKSTTSNNSNFINVIPVNSLQTVSLNNSLVEAAKKREGYYTFSSRSDIASIAYGWWLSFLDMGNLYKDAEKKQITESLPADPIFVKSYDNFYPDYYIVPFVHDKQFINQYMWSVELYNTGMRTHELPPINPQPGDLVFPREKLLKVDEIEATNIIKQTKGVNAVPVPRLVVKESEISKSPFQPFWEFTFEDKTCLYVNQDGKVFDLNIIPWYETYVAPKYDPALVQTAANKLIRTDFTVKVSEATRLEHYQTKTLQGMDVGITIENNSGTDKNFIPKGKIVGIIGKSGKVYRFTYDQQPLDQVCLRLEKARKFQEEKDHKPYQSGVFKLGYIWNVDTDDQEISKVLYLDENNQEMEIPVDGIDYGVRYVGNGK
jgi:beta-lactamase regulating signal transducer with metallopeptidase domain